MSQSLHQLIEIEWPDFGRTHQPPATTVEEFSARPASAREQMEARGYTHLVLYADREHFANLSFLTNFDPRFEEAVLVIGTGEQPLLIVGNECESYLPISPLWQAGLLCN